MKTPFKLKFNKAKKFFTKLPRILAESSFLTILALFLLSLVLGGFIYYKYVFLVKNKEPQITEKSFQFDEKTYQKVLDEGQAREKRFQEADSKKYPDPFTSTPVSSAASTATSTPTSTPPATP